MGNEQESVEVEISDTGAGIPPELLDRVFDPFFTTDPKGIGLGLSVVHTLVRENGGTVGLWSEPGKGTTVTLRLPAALEPPHLHPLPLEGERAG